MPIITSFESQENSPQNIISSIYRGLIPIIILIGGITLLSLNLPGWSTIIGLPTTIIGAVLLIYEYDNFVTKKVVLPNEEKVRCDRCGRLTRPSINRTLHDGVLCPYCVWEEKNSKKVK
ncbi:hypothetical protein IPM62_01715 [Candidatus Woesebacteria bacterium]|nr:MAG: hypothetical protein IPM62_01715 [Candidatus Woesebacteria bacterium]